MNENNGKLKKIEASLIKRLLRISWYLFKLNYGALSLSLLDTYRFLGSL